MEAQWKGHSLIVINHLIYHIVLSIKRRCLGFIAFVPSPNGIVFGLSCRKCCVSLADRRCRQRILSTIQALAFLSVRSAVWMNCFLRFYCLFESNEDISTTKSGISAFIHDHYIFGIVLCAWQINYPARRNLVFKYFLRLWWKWGHSRVYSMSKVPGTSFFYRFSFIFAKIRFSFNHGSNWMSSNKTKGKTHKTCTKTSEYFRAQAFSTHNWNAQYCSNALREAIVAVLSRISPPKKQSEWFH